MEAGTKEIDYEKRIAELTECNRSLNKALDATQKIITNHEKTISELQKSLQVYKSQSLRTKIQDASVWIKQVMNVHEDILSMFANNTAEGIITNKENEFVAPHQPNVSICKSSALNETSISPCPITSCTLDHNKTSITTYPKKTLTPKQDKSFTLDWQQPSCSGINLRHRSTSKSKKRKPSPNEKLVKSSHRYKKQRLRVRLPMPKKCSGTENKSNSGSATIVKVEAVDLVEKDRDSDSRCNTNGISSESAIVKSSDNLPVVQVHQKKEVKSITRKKSSKNRDKKLESPSLSADRNFLSKNKKNRKAKRKDMSRDTLRNLLNKNERDRKAKHKVLSRDTRRTSLRQAKSESEVLVISDDEINGSEKQGRSKQSSFDVKNCSLTSSNSNTIAVPSTDPVSENEPITVKLPFVVLHDVLSQAGPSKWLSSILKGSDASTSDTITGEEAMEKKLPPDNREPNIENGDLSNEVLFMETISETKTNEPKLTNHDDDVKKVPTEKSDTSQQEESNGFLLNEEHYEFQTSAPCKDYVEDSFFRILEQVTQITQNIAADSS